MYQLVYDPRGQMIKVSCYADLVITEPAYPKRVVLASLGGDDSSVKAIAAAICEHREIELLGDASGPRIYERLNADGKHRVLMSRTPAGHVHALVASRRVLPGEGDVVLHWDGDGPGALGRWLLASTDLPLLPQWCGPIWEVAQDREFVQPLAVHTVAESAPRAFRIVATDPQRWQDLVGQLVRRGDLAIPDAGGDSLALDGAGLNDYLATWGGHLAARAQERHRPAYLTGEPRHPALDRLAEPLYPPQADVVEGVARVLAGQPSAMIVGEMGTGKTRCGAAVAHRLYAGRRGYRVLVLCPKHLLAKWPREVRAVIPGAKTAVLRAGADVAALWPWRHTPPDGPEWFFLARDTAKLGWFLKSAAIWQEPVVKRTTRGSSTC